MTHPLAHRLNALALVVGLLLCPIVTPAQTLFTDNFTTNASPLWSNLRGAWFAANGAYSCALPNNAPPTLSALPFVLQDFAVDMDIQQVGDGGVWLRCDPTASNGILLVTGGNGWGSGVRGGNAGRSLYWHTVSHGTYSGALNQVFNVFNPGVDNIHLRIEVTGNYYAVFLNGATNPVITLTDDNNIASSGMVGLYDFSAQTFHNFSLQVPPGYSPYAITIQPADATHVNLQWPTNAFDWALEATPSLSPSAWQTLTDPPSRNGTNFVLPVEKTASPQFFRLHKP